MTRQNWTSALAIVTAFTAVLLAARAVVRAAQDAVPRATPANSSPPTWAHDIAPILYKNCSTCHHPGGGGPFSLMTYADARHWGTQMVAVTQSRFMPPWLPEPGYGNFADERRLSDDDREKIRAWVKGRMPEGNPAEAPAEPKYDGGWLMGKPDLILKVARPYSLVAAGTDVFRNFILPYPLKETHYIRAMQIRPGTPNIVHHANITIDRMASMRHQNPDTWQNGLGGMELYVDAGNHFDPDSHFLFWKPDSPALVEPEGMPWRLDPGNDMILNMHLKPSGKPETLDAEVGLYFAQKPPTKQPMLIALERDDKLDIPAGDAKFVIEDELKLPVDVEVLGVYPHAHYLGHDLEGWAILPGGEKKWLVWIRNWDIDRQSIYRLKEPLQLPRGTMLHMRYMYDNSAANVHNPHSPPIRVRAGNRSEDEMGHLWLQVLPINTKPGDPDPRLKLEEAWMRRRLEKTPDDTLSLYNLSAALAGEGKFSEATEGYRQILKRTPKDPRTLTALGVALNGEGNWRDAEESFRSAMNAGSTACDARFNLANLELEHRELTEAERDFRSLMEDCAPDAEMHAGLGATLARMERSDEAGQEFNRALEMDGNNVQALLGLGELELDASRTDEAAGLLRRAVNAAADSADAHWQLARAYGMSGRQSEALDELRTAERLKPEDAEIHSAIAQVLTGEDKLQEAIAEERAALKLEEIDPDGWNNLGVLLLRSGQVTEAKAALEHALRLDPNHAQARANLEGIKEQR